MVSKLSVVWSGLFIPDPDPFRCRRPCIPVHREYRTLDRPFISSVADPRCLTRIRIFPIPDLGSASKNLSVLTKIKISKL